MNPADYTAPSAGRVIQAPGGYGAFVPALLPPEIRYTPDLVLELSRADTTLSELSGLGRYLPNPNLLIAPYVRREAILSSRIEGTRAGLNELWLDEMDAAPSEAEADVREVRNYVTALEYGIERLASLPLSLRLVRELHARLMRGVRGEQLRPGEFRQEQNFIGPPGSTLATATYVPPPVAEMRALLENWEGFLHSRDQIPDLVQCALLHEQFEAIHPFRDGNGRIGRLLIPLFLIERGRLSQPLLYLSAFFEARRADYYESLQRVRTRGDWEGWLRFFLVGVAETARAAVQLAGELSDLRETYRERLREKPRALALVDHLFANPYLTIARATSLLRVSQPTARQAVLWLEREGLLVETTGGAWRRLYVARPILEAVDKPGLSLNSRRSRR